MKGDDDYVPSVRRSGSFAIAGTKDYKVFKVFKVFKVLTVLTVLKWGSSLLESDGVIRGAS
jgi:hypothetical protein